MKTTILKILPISIFLLFPILVFTQNTFQRTYGTSGHEVCSGIELTLDGGYIMVGRNYDFTSNDYDVYIVKTDSSGKIAWTKTLRGSKYDEGGGVIVQNDGYIICGTTQSYGAGIYDIFLTKLNLSGDTLWTRTYGQYGWDFVRLSHCIYPVSDSLFAIAGTGNTPSGKECGLLILVNINGDTLWTKKYMPQGNLSDSYYIKSVKGTPDGGFILSGNTDLIWSLREAFVIRTNANGDTIWTRAYGNMQWDLPEVAIPTSDNGFLIAGISNSFSLDIFYDDIYLIKTDANGDTLWTRGYGGHMGDYANDIKELPDGSFVVLGQTASYGGLMEYDVFLLKIDKDGNPLWMKIYGGDQAEYASTFRLTPDGGFLIFAMTNSFGAGQGDFYIIKTDSLGNSGSCYEKDTLPMMLYTDTQVGYSKTVVSSGLQMGHAPFEIFSGGTKGEVCCVPELSFTSINYNSTVAFSSTLAYADSVVWHFGDGGSSKVFDPVHNYTANGTYTVKLIAYNHCSKDSLSDKITISEVGITQYLNSGIKVFPNPASGFVNVEYNLAKEKPATIEVFDINGNKKLSWKGDLTGKTQIEIKDLGAGIYFIVLQAEGFVIFREKLVVMPR